MRIKSKKIAFVVGMFPVVSETWLINQVAYLMEQGVDIEVFSFKRGGESNISDRFFEHKMSERTHYLNMPENFLWRLYLSIPKVFMLAVNNPQALLRALNFKRYGRRALSLELIYWTAPFVDKRFDIFHCHHGTVAKHFLEIKYVLGLKDKMVTTFYGQDVSRVFKAKGEHYYDELKKESSVFIVMSDFMKKRIVAEGFDEGKIRVLPVFGINVGDYQFKERTLREGEVIQMASVGRFVEKKGFDDLLKALYIVKSKTNKKFICNIIGDGQLKPKLETMTKELGLTEVISYKGYMKVEDMISCFDKMHFYLQPSKTASDGDME